MSWPWPWVAGPHTALCPQGPRPVSSGHGSGLKARRGRGSNEGRCSLYAAASGLCASYDATPPTRSLPSNVSFAVQAAPSCDFARSALRCSVGQMATEHRRWHLETSRAATVHTARMCWMPKACHPSGQGPLLLECAIGQPRRVVVHARLCFQRTCTPRVPSPISQWPSRLPIDHIPQAA